MYTHVLKCISMRKSVQPIEMHGDLIVLQTYYSARQIKVKVITIFLGYLEPLRQKTRLNELAWIINRETYAVGTTFFLAIISILK